MTVAVRAAVSVYLPISRNVKKLETRSLTEMTDRILIELVLSGDRDAFGEIVERYRRRAFLAAISIVGNEQDAIDLSQEAFIRAYRFLNRFDLERPFYPWFYRILKNRCLSFLRKRKRRSEVSLENFFDLSSPDVDRDKLRLVRECVAALPEHHRELLALRYYQGYAYQEIADMLGKPIGSIMSGLYYARQKLKCVLEEKGL